MMTEGFLEAMAQISEGHMEFWGLENKRGGVTVQSEGSV